MAKTFIRLRKETLKRILGVFDLFAIGYGDLGSSIFYALGVTALFSLGATPISLAFAGFAFICTALSYAELCSMFPGSGGSAQFARKAFNDFISFGAGWGLLLDYIVTIAISSFAVGTYLSYFFPFLEKAEGQIWFAIGLIFFLFLLNVKGIKQSKKVSIFLTMLTLLVKVIVIVLGAYYLLKLSDIIYHCRIADPAVPTSPSWFSFWQGTAMAMVAYTGIESIAQLGEETRKPAAIVPRAIVITMLVVVVMYLGISLVSLSAVSPLELGTKYVTNPFVAIIQALPVGGWILPTLGALIPAAILAAAANAGLIGSSRLSFNMGEYYQLPHLFYKTHPTLRTPIVALAFFSIIASLIIFVSQAQMDFLADLYNFGAMLAFLATHLSLIVLRIKKPDLERPFKLSCTLPFKGKRIPITAILGALVTFGVWCLIVITKPAGRYLGVAWMIFGIIMYVYYRKSQKIAPTSSLTVEKISLPGYKALKVKKIFLPVFEKMPLAVIQMACAFAKEYHAQLTVVVVLEIHASIPLESRLSHRVMTAKMLLKTVEAICREHKVLAHYELLRTRSSARTILEKVVIGKYDLLILGQKHQTQKKNEGRDPLISRLIREAPCRVLIAQGHMRNDQVLT